MKKGFITEETKAALEAKVKDDQQSVSDRMSRSSQSMSESNLSMTEDDDDAFENEK